MNAWETFIEKLQNDVDLQNKMEACETPEEIHEFAKEYGVTLGEIVEFITGMRE